MGQLEGARAKYEKAKSIDPANRAAEANYYRLLAQFTKTFTPGD
jgi:hypothetical protein